MSPDERLMSRALSLAARGRGFVSPNPMVGCVLAKGGRVIAEGHHGVFGGPHAEAEALSRAGVRARGATAYVTLEPCAHWGKTPPCSEALVRAGVKRVVVAVKDPHPVAGTGLAGLRQGGVKTTLGVLASDARLLNRAFFKAHTTGLPYVVWKTAQTLDGKIASRTGASKWISGPKARDFAHRLRAESDAVLVGGNTVREDNPALTAHGKGVDPVRLILSPSLRLSPRAHVFHGDVPVCVLSGMNPPNHRSWMLAKAGVKILKCFINKNSEWLINCFKFLRKIGINQILVEGGGETSSALLSAGLIDEVYHVIAPSYLGGRDATTALEGDGWAVPAAGPRLLDWECFRLGDDLVLHGFMKAVAG